MDLPPDESGYEAWLRYPKTGDHRLRAAATALTHVWRAPETGACGESAMDEWSRGLLGMFGLEVQEVHAAKEAGMVLAVDASLPAEGWRISFKEQRGLRIEGGDPTGVLYGAFAALEGLQRGREPAALAGSSSPSLPLRILNHWDNLVADPVHGSIERGKGGDTIFDWTDLARPNPRYQDYARLIASVGLNATCLNNVNADPQILAAETISGLASLAAVLRPCGIRIFVSVNFASPVLLGGLDTADPLAPEVERWWMEKADEIYAMIPDFGGFLVKADSEGKPGPGTYGRSHVEGSACLARALAPHGGTLIWRAFVYNRDLSSRTPHARAAADRANHASYEFMHLDGQFPDNVILQIKCSAIDFQVWEPVHALFANMPNSRLCLEFSLTKEYSGQDTHLGWEGRYFHSLLNAPAGNRSGRSTVAERLSSPTLPGAIAAVANINNSRNWFGHLLHGASLYTYGRLAWNPAADPEALLGAWNERTFGTKVAPEITAIMADSYDIVAAYTMPMGLTYISEFLHHYEPDPWENHKGAGITKDGLGTDRTRATGSGYTGLYPTELAELFENPVTCPDRFLLYFHHLPWGHRMPDRRTLIQTLYDSYHQGVAAVHACRQRWRALHGRIDLERWAHVYEKLSLQASHAERWRDLVCRFLLETSAIADDQGRAGSPSPHNRISSGFAKAVGDHRARVERERARLRAKESAGA